MKVVVNRCYGGFGLSPEAEDRFLREKLGKDVYPYIEEHADVSDLAAYMASKKFVRVSDLKSVKNKLVHFSNVDLGEEAKDIPSKEYVSFLPERSDPILVRIVEEMGEAANGECADLEIVEIPDDVEWEVNDYDGMESIHEKHSSW